MRFAIHFNGHITLQDVADALAAKGIHLRSDGAGRTLADPVPAILKREAEPAAENVVGMPIRARKAAR